MAWEHRRGRSYYYEAERVGDRVQKRYVGSGPAASAISRLAEMDADRRHFDRWREKREREAATEKYERVWMACDRAGALAALLVQAAGYHQHHRGAWRKQQVRTKTATTTAGNADLIPATEEEQKAVINRALGSSDKALQARAVAILHEHPDAFVSQYLADVQRVVHHLAKDNDAQAVVLIWEARRLRDDLREGRAASEVPPAERLLIERVVACRFALARAEEVYHGAGSVTLDKATYLEKSIDRAHTRYLKAVKTLAEVRRLALPALNVALPGAVQVNHGDKQINVTR